MKLITFAAGGAAKPGLWLGEGRALDLQAADRADRSGADVSSVIAFIAAGEAATSAAKRWLAAPPAEAIVANVQLLAPIPRPARNVFCIGRNYLDHVKELNNDTPKYETFFTKQPNAVVGPEADVSVARDVTQKLDYEVELAVVIGKPGRDIPAARAMDHVFGYSIGNDITARDLQSAHGQFFKGKALDTTCPLGPWIVTRDEIADVRALELTLSVNGERRQNGRVEQMIFDIPTMIATLSKGMAMEPGDIILTGTPSGVGHGMKPPQYLKDGDVVTCTITQIGQLTNTIRMP
jgi:2-keto-4-pentenoate hydratase/2-oxohepta-3-ene-1,7-dioic acid hydratase in catechol pathway